MTPSADGKPIDLPVEMQPATGAVSGTVTGTGRPARQRRARPSPTARWCSTRRARRRATSGTFSFTGVSTPGHVHAAGDRAGPRHRGRCRSRWRPGEQRGGVNIRMRAGVGSISGRVTEGGTPLGGVTLTASNGDTTVETTSLTEGATGTYLFPRLDIPGRWTIEARLDGYVTQTRLVNLTGNVSGVDFAFVKQTGAITGLVESSHGGGAPGANVRVARDELRFETQTAAAPDPGSFNIRDLPPGTYLVEFTRYDHEPTSQTVTIEPGQVVDLGTIDARVPAAARRSRRTAGSRCGSSTARATRSPHGPTCRGRRCGCSGTPTTASSPSRSARRTSRRSSSSRCRSAPTASRSPAATTYRLATRRTSVGLVNVVETIPIYLLGQVHGRLIDSADRDRARRLRRPDPPRQPRRRAVRHRPEPPRHVGDAHPSLMPDGSLQRRFETRQPAGPDERARTASTVDNPPPGYRVAARPGAAGRAAADARS